jgi:energy-coupling factor transporter ATP-binding protein EcfA2
LPAALAASSQRKGIICPAENGGEAAFAGDVEVLAPASLLALVNHMKGQQVLRTPEARAMETHKKGPDLGEVRGQAVAKRALEIAAAGGHNLLMIGPPGSGKSMLAACLPGILPSMSPEEMLETNLIASVAGKDGNPNASAYSASKAAVMAITKSLGKELASSHVRVNCVTPAAVKTAIFDQMTPEHIQFMLSKIPMGRFGTPEEVAAMVTWLLTEDCSFSTGAVFDLSGGRSTY